MTEITRITRKHLEDAARAAGHTEARYEDWPGMEVRHGYSCAIWTGEHYINPAENDGDSRRLQIVVGIILQPLVDHPACNAWLSGLNRVGHSVRVQHDGTPADAARAAREAVILCAAEVGRRMREANHGIA
jgi:hypothetical protein